MPVIPARRSMATLTSAAVIGASVAVLLVSPVSTMTAHAAVAPGSTLRASVNTGDNAESPTGGRETAVSSDGNAVAFTSRSKLDNVDTRENNAVYVRDLVSNRTVMISRGQFTFIPPTEVPGFGSNRMLNLAAQPAPDQAPDGDSFAPSVSHDGRFVAFVTRAFNIVRDGGVGPQFLPDGVGRDVVVVDRAPNGTFDRDVNGKRDYAYFLVNNPANGSSVSDAKLSADGSRIVWHETDCVQFCHDTVNTRVLEFGVPDGPIQTLQPDIGNDTFVFGQFDPAISGDGQHIVVHAEVNGCTDCGDKPDFHAILSYSVATGVTTRVDIDADKTPISEDFTMFVMHPAVNSDGTVISFVGEQFTDDDGQFFSTFHQPNVYAVNVNYGTGRVAGQVTRSVIASRDNAGGLIDGQEPALSADGRFLAFVTDSPNAHDGTDQPQERFNCINPNNTLRMGGGRMLDFSAKLPPERPNAPRTVCQVVLRDLIIDRSNPTPRPPGTLISVSNNGTAAGRFESGHPSVTADGGRVGFDSDALDLLPQPDANETTDAFVRILGPEIRNDPHDFGTVNVGDSSKQSVRLTVNGQGPLVIEKITVGGTDQGDFTLGTDTCIGQALHGSESCLVSVTFSPKALGARNGLLVIQVRGNRTFRVTLTGTGGEAPKGPKFANDQDLNFGQRLLLSNGPEKTVTITNGGDLPLKITAVTVVGPSAPGDYTISGNTCGTVAPKGGTCTVSVKFSPTLPGDRPARLQFSDNVPNSPQQLVALSGQGLPMAIQVNPGITPGGRVTTVTGTGFPPGKTVTITFQQRVGQGTATVADDGTFRGSLLVFPKASPETRTVVATVDGAPALFATTPLLVVFDTVKPADFVLRH